MASRQEEKQRRREARLEAERKAQAAAARTRRLQIVGGTVAAVLVLFVAGFAVLKASGGSKGGGKPKSDVNTVAIPARKTTNLAAAIKTAGCTLKSYPGGYEDRGHVPTTTKVHYKTNPPSFGKHFEVPASDGDYAGVKTPEVGHWVHSLEHGRIQYQYAPGTPQRQVRGLETLWKEDPDLVMVFKNNTNMPFQVAAVAWTHILGCKTFTPGVYDAFRAFRDKYRLKGPEVIPQPE